MQRAREQGDVDDVPIWSTLVDLLSDAGYHATEVNTGVEAFDWLRKHQPDLVVLDLMMPAMSGWSPEPIA